MKRTEKARRFVALVLAFVMVFTSLTVIPAATHDTDAMDGNGLTDTSSAPSIGVVPPVVDADTSSPPSIGVDDCVLCDGEGCEYCLSNKETGCEKCDYEGCFDCEFGGDWLGAPPVPIFSHEGGVHSSQFQLSIECDPITQGQTIVRFAVDGSVPVACPQAGEDGHVSAQWHEWNSSRAVDQLWWPPECGCSWVLPPGQTIPINFVEPWRYFSPMSVLGVGRASAGAWSVPWSRQDQGLSNKQIEDSAYTSPHNTNTVDSAAGADWTRNGGTPPWQGGTPFDIFHEAVTEDGISVFYGNSSRPPQGTTRQLRRNTNFNRG